MQDSEEHSFRRSSPRQNGQLNSYHEDIAAGDSVEDILEQKAHETALPPYGLSRALFIGAIGAICSVALNIILAFASTPLLQQVANNKSQTASSADIIAASLGCLEFLLPLLISLAAGWIIGKNLVQRRLGFYAGALVAGVTYIASFLVRYIPNYPGNLPTHQPTNAAAISSGIVISLVFLLIWALVGGLFGLWGARMATKHHPYYWERQEE
jgi:hypothetical protein